MGGNSSERNKKADNYLYFNEITVVSSIVWLVWWMSWCPVYNMEYMKNKQNNEFSHFS
jgi:hypothetical protein